ncbi:MAG: pyridoxal-phosphate dependent enzyme [Gemmataceae bacterium]
MSIWRFADWIDKVPPAARITLGEGNSPLVQSRRLGSRLGLANLYFKLDYVSPTGSYKDRFAAAAISHMVAQGRRLCVATSSGNTGAALAGYCAVAGIECVIAIVETAPAEKLAQMLAYGARLFRVRGFGLDPEVSGQVFGAIQKRGSAEDAAVQISAYHFSPAGMSGVETLGHELADQLPERIDHVFCPAGGGGLVLALTRAFARQGRSVAVECVQPAGNDTIATPLRSMARQARDVSCTTKISGLQVPNVIDGHAVIEACRACGGTGHTVSDEEVWNVQALLAREEGIFTEPAGAVSVAGALKAAACGELQPDAVVVCVVTGMGFKDRPAVDRMVQHLDAPLVDPVTFVKQLHKE